MSLIKDIFAHIAYLVVLERIDGRLASKLALRLPNSITEIGTGAFWAEVVCYRVTRVFVAEFFSTRSFRSLATNLDLDTEIACCLSILVRLIRK